MNINLILKEQQIVSKEGYYLISTDILEKSQQYQDEPHHNKPQT